VVDINVSMVYAPFWVMGVNSAAALSSHPSYDGSGTTRGVGEKRNASSDQRRVAKEQENL
jgi:hypothetical protein